LLLARVENHLRNRIENDWATRPHWKQRADGFRISSFAIETLRTINQTEPERLAHLYTLFRAEQNLFQKWALARLRTEFGRRQLSPLARISVWAETILALPVACYGLLNHLSMIVANALLSSLRRKVPRQTLGLRVRAVVLIGCYAIQVIAVNWVLGRAAAGYYALTLPVSGAYVIRYRWLLRQRTRILLLGRKARGLGKRFENSHRRVLGVLDATLRSVMSRNPLRDP